MKAHTIESTKDYSRFVHNEHQQPMSAAHVEKIAASMREHGFIPSKPVQVYRRADGKFVIVDGHHRFNASKLLGIPVLYVVESEKAQDSMGVENYCVKKWAAGSFVNMYAGRGLADFVALNSFVNAGFNVNQAASLLRGESASSNNFGHALRDGSFRIKTRKSCETILEIVSNTGLKVLMNRHYVDALSMLLFVKEFDVSTAITRLKANPMMVVPVANREQALEVIEEAYNFRSQKKINFAFMATEAAKERKANFGNKSVE